MLLILLFSRMFSSVNPKGKIAKISKRTVNKMKSDLCFAIKFCNQHPEEKNYCASISPEYAKHYEREQKISLSKLQHEYSGKCENCGKSSEHLNGFGFCKNCSIA